MQITGTSVSFYSAAVHSNPNNHIILSTYMSSVEKTFSFTEPEPIGGFPIKIKPEIGYLIIYSYFNFVR